MSHNIDLCKCHPDFHMPEYVIVGDEFDGIDYATKAKNAGIDSIVMFAKCHYGFSYYHTDIGTRHPGLYKDMVQEFTQGCSKVGIRSTVYYSIFLDSAAANLHPDWQLKVLEKDNRWTYSGNYIPLCANSPYLEELLLPQVIELIDNYNINEFFFDTMSRFVPCYCEYCQKKFKKPIPLSSDSEYWLEYVNWYYQQYEDFFNKIIMTIHNKNPKTEVVFNWKWSATLPETPNKFIKTLAGDLFATPTCSSHYSHYWAGTGYNFDYMCGRFMHSLGDWTNNTSLNLKSVASSTIANCGNVYLIDRQLPNGKMEDRTYQIMSDVFSFVKERKDMIVDTAHVPETGVLYSLENLTGINMELFPDAGEREKKLDAYKAISTIFMKNAIHYTSFNCNVLKQRIHEYELLILPEIEFLDDDVKNILNEYVENGGKLLIIQSTNTQNVDMDLLDLAGVECIKASENKYNYVEYSIDGISNPLLIRGNFVHAIPKSGTKCINSVIEPVAVGDVNKSYGHGFAPPSYHNSEYSFASIRDVGKGRVAYVSGPILSSYQQFYHPHLADCFVKIYNELMPTPMVKVDTKAIVEKTMVRQNNDLIVHLINHSGCETFAKTNMPVTEFVPEINDITIEIKSSKDKYEIRSYPSGLAKIESYKDGYMHISIDSLYIMTSIRIKGYFN